MDFSISKKLVLFIYSSIFILFVILSAILLFLAEQVSREQLTQSSFDELKYGNLMIEKEQQYLYGLSDYYSISPEVQKMMINSNKGKINVSMSDDIVRVLKARMYTVGLAFYNIRGEAIDFISIDRSKNPISQTGVGIERPFTRLIQGQRTYEWEFIDKDDTVYMEFDNSPKLCLWRVVKNVNTMKPIGVVSISIDSRKLLSSENTFSGLYDKLVILDDYGRKVFNNSKITFSHEACKKLTLATAGNKSGSFIKYIDSRPYRVYYTRVGKTSLITYLIMPYMPFTWNMQVFTVYALTGMTLFTLLLLPLLIIIANMLTKPLQKLTKSMLQFSEGDFDAEVSFKYNDEIGKLGQVFNSMVQENKKLIEHTYILKLKEKEAELSALQAQINPHFLYNSINAIQWSALRKGDNEIADIAHSMGQVFRISLNRGNNIISVKQERDLINYYLKLQKKRYGERIQYSISFSNDVLELKIPKLIIQPLVENSIVHGIENSKKNVHIWVSAYLDDDTNNMVIEVEDDGIGIPPKILELLPDKLEADSNSHGNQLAIRNINERLKLFFEDRYSFIFVNRLLGGAIVKIVIPIESYSEHDVSSPMQSY